MASKVCRNIILFTISFFACLFNLVKKKSFNIILYYFCSQPATFIFNQLCFTTPRWCGRNVKGQKRYPYGIESYLLYHVTIHNCYPLNGCWRVWRWWLCYFLITDNNAIVSWPWSFLMQILLFSSCLVPCDIVHRVFYNE